MDESATATRKRRKGWDQQTPAGKLPRFNNRKSCERIDEYQIYNFANSAKLYDILMDNGGGLEAIIRYYKLNSSLWGYIVKRLVSQASPSCEKIERGSGE